MNGYVIFSDIKGYSKLSEQELRKFVELLGELAPILKEYQQQSKVWNTWGDALFAIFEDGKPAVNLALTYRDFFKSFPYDKHKLRKLTPRIAGHFGEFHVFDDPLTEGRKNAVGSHVNCAARIEPVTRPGEIFVSEDFKKRIEALPEKIPGIAFGALGTVELAKAFGELEVYRLYPDGEKAHQQIDALTRLDLGPVLPEPMPMSNQEKLYLAACNAAESTDALDAKIADKDFLANTSTFITSLAEVCKRFGLYEKALDLLSLADQASIEADGIQIHPHRHEIELAKLRANCLTRLGKFDDASEIMYGLWRSGHQDSDTLSMLAAQYKRRAIYNNIGHLLSSSKINTELLIRARSLYIEAFRRNISDYYPLINAAYIYSFEPIRNRSYTTKLSRYIIESFSPDSKNKTDNWWHASTLAEAEMLQHCTDDAIEMISTAIATHNPDKFMLESTATQITIYGKLANSYDEIKGILQVLRAES